MSLLLPIPDGPIAGIVAHPDDETFGLGALLAALAGEGREVRVLCLTRGEASTVGSTDGLGDIRSQELVDAADVLGVAEVTLLDLPDGGLEAIGDAELAGQVDAWLTPEVVALVVFEPAGVTGHPDHRAATRAAERVADERGLPVVEWGINPRMVSRMREEHGLEFEPMADGPGVLDVQVDRTIQIAAIQRHRSQLDDDPEVCRLLAVEGDVERVRIREPLPRRRED
jgi:N-acetylglucosamine malate deacetylase 2